jgi:anti-sigma28 factor (negative regulator of flagellin synthesis)
MNIHGVNFVHRSQGLSSPHQVSAPATPASSSLSEVDQLDISPSGDMASRALDASALRAERLAHIRSEIQAGRYDTDDKLNLALDRLLEEIA